MALSDMNEKPAPWIPDPLLNSKARAPRFLRTQWDEACARSFGPWRIADKADPADGLMTERTDVETLEAETNGSNRTTPSEAPITAPDSELPWTASTLGQLRDESYQRGLHDGQTQVHTQFEAERQKERELMRHLGIELRSISQDPQRFFEPLKRLSLHLAEQLVRAELQLSGQAVHQLIQECIQQLDHAVEPVTVSVNPEDLQRLKAMGDSISQHMQLQADAQLRPGSVRVRVQDSLVQDLIEHRLEPLARRLLAQPEDWMQQSCLVTDRAEALPADTPVRDWQRQVIDVEDTAIKPESTPDVENP